jgi:hypothetical protein
VAELLPLTVLLSFKNTPTFAGAVPSTNHGKDKQAPRSRRPGLPPAVQDQHLRRRGLLQAQRGHIARRKEDDWHPRGLLAVSGHVLSVL